MWITNAQLILYDRVVPGAVRIQDDKITKVLTWTEEGDAGLEQQMLLSPGEEVLDAEGKYLSPGFIDVHIHGAGGHDTMEGTEEALSCIGEAIARHGVTGFVPTTMTTDKEAVRQAVEGIARFKKQHQARKNDAKTNNISGGMETDINNVQEYQGAEVLGVHLEGPFINPSMIRSQNPKYVLPPSVENLQYMLGDHEEDLMTVTLAPEEPGARELIQYIRSLGAHASMGHAAASYQQAVAATTWGIDHATHLYNGMPPFHHREPGMVGATFDTSITTEMIADKEITLSYAAQRLALKAKGVDEMLLVSDAMMAACMPEGEYSLGGQQVFVKDGACRLADGTLAGTLLTLDEAVQNIHAETDLPLWEIFRMVTWNPAKFCHVENRKGAIAEGYDADLVLMNADLTVEKVFVRGELFN